MSKSEAKKCVKNFSPKVMVNKLTGLIKKEAGLVYTAIGNLGAAVLGGLFWFILAGLLPVDSYGIVNYYIAIANIFFAIGLFGLDATVTTFLAKGEAAFHYQATSLTLISAIAIAAILSIYEWSSATLAATMIFFMMSVAETLGKKMYRQYAILFISQRVVQIVLSIVLYYQLGITGILIGYIIGNLIFSVRYFRNALPNFSLRFNEIKQKRNFAMHNYGTGLIRTFSTFLDKLIIALLFGYYVLGLYQLGFQFFLFLSIIPLSLYSYLLPEESSGKDKKTIKLLGIALSVVAAISAMISLPFVIERFFSNFTGSILIVQIMSVAVIPATVIAILNATLLGRGNSKVVFMAGISYIVSLVVGLVTLGQILGAVGLAVTLLFAQIIQATFLTLKRKSPELKSSQPT